MPTANGALTQPLHAFLLTMAAGGATHQQEHQMQHLLSLLLPDDEEALLHYYGLFGHEQMALDEIARERGEMPEQVLTAIGRSLRKLAITPEWQTVISKTI